MGHMGIIMHRSRWQTGVMGKGHRMTGHMSIIMHKSRWETGPYTPCSGYISHVP